MNKPLFLFVGKSGSGKSTIANMLGKINYKQLYSYTTRPQRNARDIEHVFVSYDEFNKLTDLVAYTHYNEHYYGATAKQVDETDIYVIDPPGVESLLKKYKNKDRNILVVYFDTTVHTRIKRMLNRYDSDNAIVGRLLQDEERDWWEWLDQITYEVDNVSVCHISADENIGIVYQSVLSLMHTYEQYEVE